MAKTRPRRMKIGRLRTLKFIVLSFLAVAVPLVTKSLIRKRKSVPLDDDVLPQELQTREEYMALMSLHDGREQMKDGTVSKAFNITSEVLDGHQNVISGDTESATNDALRPGSATKILLVTYYRGGSSFLGELFGNNPEAFYVFEPLYGVRIDSAERKQIAHMGIGQLIDGSHTILPNETVGPLPINFMERRYEQLSRLYHCQVSAMDKKIVNSVMFKSATHMPHFRTYRTCLSTNNTGCPKLLDDACERSPLVAVKTIRIPMYGIPEILEKVPDLKVIHYIRDPRGMLLSRQRWERTIRGKAVHRKARDLCLQMVHNLYKFHELKSKNPDRYLLVKYEDLAVESEKVTKEIYDFVGKGKAPPATVLRWLEINTKQEIGNAKDAFSTRRNSTRAAYSWRTKWSQQEINDMTEACEEELPIMGYSL